MASELHIVISKDHRPERIYHLAGAEASIGRTASNAICLPHDTVSRQHSVIIRHGSCFVIRDLGSRNGTRLNGEPLTEAVIHNSAVVEIGPYSLTACADLVTAKRLAGEIDDSTLASEARPPAQLTILEARLTAAQRRVYEALMLGHSEKEVANKLQLSVNTVHSHARIIYSKFEVSSRPELMAMGVKQVR